MCFRAVAVLMALSIVASACSGGSPSAAPGGDGDGSATTTSSTRTPTTTTTTTTAAPRTTGAPATAVELCPGRVTQTVDQFVVLAVANAHNDLIHQICDESTGIVSERRVAGRSFVAVLGDDGAGGMSVLFGGEVEDALSSFGLYRFDTDGATLVEEIELPLWERSLTCDEDGVLVRDFELPTTVRDPFLRWTETREGVVTDEGSLDLRVDYEAAWEVVSTDCGGTWFISPPFAGVAVLFGLLLEELGFTDLGYDHTIDPISAAVGSYGGEQYGISIDIDYQGHYDPVGEWSRDCDLAKLTLTPAPSPELLAGLVDLAGCPPA